MIRKTRFLFSILGMILVAGAVMVADTYAQQTEPIGGPYQSDSATVLLMHFDQDFSNDNADKYQIADPNIFGNISFLQMQGAGDLDYQVRFDNDSPDDKSHIQVPDTTALDLNGSWTMEMWVNVFTFGTTQDDWRRQPRLYFKAGDGGPDGDDVYYHANYHFNIFGTNRDFGTGYWSPDDGTHISIRSPDNVLEIGEWFHLTFIRDTSKQVIVQMIHQNAENKGRLPNANDDELELIHFDSYGYGADGLTGDPVNTSEPLFIATSPQNDTAFANLDGFMDEVRISNTVRNFAVPPIIKGVTSLDNQQAGETYEVEATIETLGSAGIASADLHYQVDDGSWETTTMAEGSNNLYTASIPSQQVGTSVNYYIKAETDGGLAATSPATAESDSTYYNFAVWTDSIEVFSMNFDEGSGVPNDDSQFGEEITFHSAAESPSYAAGDEGGDDMAFEFNASDSTWLETTSAVHQLTNFAVEFKFYAQDSVPATDTRLLAKGSSSAFYWSNYQVYFDPGGAMRPAIYMPDNGLDPCGSFTGGCLVMDGEDERVQAETWYNVQIGVKGPEVAEGDTTGRVFARFMDVATGDTVAERIHPTEAGAYNNSSSLKIGGSGGASPYFNGLIDDIKIYNYVPEGYADSVATAIDEPAELPRRVTLGKNYPNPFNPTTQIEFRLPQSSDIELSVFDVLGRKVATLVDGKRSAGEHSVQFDASGLSSGVYLYRLETTEVTKTRKMLLLK